MRRSPKPPRTITVAKIRVFLIDPAMQKILPVKIPMDPRAVQEMTGKLGLAWAALHRVGHIDVMLGGDRTPQIGLLTGDAMEATYIVTDHEGKEGPLLHGRGLIFGFFAETKKAVSTPVNIEWVKQHVIWKSGVVDAHRPGEILSEERVEDQSGKVGETPQS